MQRHWVWNGVGVPRRIAGAASIAVCVPDHDGGDAGSGHSGLRAYVRSTEYNGVVEDEKDRPDDWNALTAHGDGAEPCSEVGHR